LIKEKQTGTWQEPKTEKRRTKLRQENNSANQIRKALGTCQDPIFSFFPDLVHDDRRQRGFIVENAVVPLLPYLPSDENNRRSQPFGRRGSGRCDGLPIINDLGSTFSKAAHKIRTREPGGRRGPDALGETAFKEDVPSRLGGASAELAGGGMRPSPFCQAVGSPKAILDGEPIFFFLIATNSAYKLHKRKTQILPMAREWAERLFNQA
jgi:hypothetical protein